MAGTGIIKTWVLYYCFTNINIISTVAPSTAVIGDHPIILQARELHHGLRGLLCHSQGHTNDFGCTHLGCHGLVMVAIDL
jgi:hypothetical protein